MVSYAAMLSTSFNFQPSYNWWAGHGGKLDRAAQACAFEQAKANMQEIAKVRGQIGQIGQIDARSSLFCLVRPR